MTELESGQNPVGVLASLEGLQSRNFARSSREFFQNGRGFVGSEPKMRGSGLVGFGSYHCYHPRDHWSVDTCVYEPIHRVIDQLRLYNNRRTRIQKGTSMNNALRFVFLLLAGVASGTAAYGQITITAGDVALLFAPGNNLVQNQDTITTSLDIGSPGATSWDFSGFQVAGSTATTTVDPATTPYSAEFPGATHALQSNIELSGISGTAYQYLTLSTNLLNPGLMGGASTFLGPVTLKETYSPPYIVYSLPSTLGTMWSTSYTSTEMISLNGTSDFGRLSGLRGNLYG